MPSHQPSRETIVAILVALALLTAAIVIDAAVQDPSLKACEFTDFRPAGELPCQR